MVLLAVDVVGPGKVGVEHPGCPSGDVPAAALFPAQDVADRLPPPDPGPPILISPAFALIDINEERIRKGVDHRFDAELDQYRMWRIIFLGRPFTKKVD